MKTPRTFQLVLLSLALSGVLSVAAIPQTPESILAQIERLASLGTKGDQDLSGSIAEKIENNPKGVAALLLPILSDPGSSEARLATCAWALGWTKDPAAVEGLVNLHRRSNSPWVKQNCLRAMAMIGGRTAGEYLLSVFDGSSDKDMRYEILNLLGEMQYEPALTRTEEVLKEDPKEYYWKSIFVFGKMGDKAVPFLLGKISNVDPNVRTHAIHILGQWLMAPEATQTLQDHFWKESDADLRVGTLSALERTSVDFAKMKTFFEQVVAEEKAASVSKFAKETLEALDKINQTLAEYVQKKKVSAADFDREYSRLYKSTGHEGDYELLGFSSSIGDEPKLKALRERILFRNSDESFYDYEKVNRIIWLNRLMAQQNIKK